MFKFHPIIHTIYKEVQEWLSSRNELQNYRNNNALSKVKKKLTEETFESAALQYYVLFPAHSTKVAFTLETVISHDSIAQWLKHNSQITVIDIGCGAGAASVAFVDCLLKLKDAGRIDHPICVHFMAIDPNKYAIAIYYQQLERLKSKVKEYDFDITLKLITESDLRAVNELREELNRQKGKWTVPCLAHTFLFQANVVSPFSTRYNETEAKRQQLVALGIPSEELSKTQNMFGKEEATAYKQILENATIDNLHIITVGTEGFEQYVSELALAIDMEFKDNNHIVARANGGELSVEYVIPETCYWKEHKQNPTWTFSFCAEVSSISNVALADEDWRDIQSVQNLQAAWARARHHLLEQTLVDEVEIRLFESRLEANIARLKQQLIAYAQDVVHTDDRLHFKFPKSDTKLRPLGLSRIEEEILSTALIQKLGQRVSGIASRSYAYKFSRTYGDGNTEYLYENWFDAYGRYINDARSAALNNKGCVIIQTDIKSFYTRIIRDSLVQLSNEQLSRSHRVEWLLKVLFARDIDDHEAGKGIVQGNIASGFFANLYLVDLDARFGPGNEWNAEFFRYVDDMIIVVPRLEDVQEILTELESELAKIGLELNQEKTEHFTNPTEFISSTEKDETLDNLQSQFQNWINCLWILDSQHRQIFRRAYNGSQAEWWYRIELYCTFLKALGILIDLTTLSRKIYKYLFNDRLCEKDFEWEEPLEVPPLPDHINQEQLYSWKGAFEEKNKLWVEKKNKLHDLLQELLTESRQKLAEAINNGDVKSEKQWIRTLRFCINKLLQIEFQSENIAQVILEILLESPWLIRNPRNLVENLATRGYSNHIKCLLVHYGDETDETKEYMKSIALRAIRFLPTVSDDMWVQVVESAISQSNVISLMATETWLKVIINQPKLVKDTDLQKIVSALGRNPRPILRLRKNYLLILGEHQQESPVDDKGNEDNLIQNVREIIRANEINSLFDYHEPEIITREFYSGNRDDGFYHPSSP